MPRIVATSDLHVDHAENRRLVARLGCDPTEDWLVVAGDVATRIDDVVWALGVLRERFAKVVWCPGNHELWTAPGERPRGVERYRRLVDACRDIDVVTPEEPYPVWHGAEGDLVVVPLFLLYDYSFRSARTKEAALARAYATGVVCADELLLDPHPYASREEWCHARVADALARVSALPPGTRTLLVAHFPLRRELVDRLRHPEFAIWCGTRLTEDWHVRLRATVVVTGHLHMRSSYTVDGVRFEDVSLGYPREWRRRGAPEVFRIVAGAAPGEESHP